MADGIVTLTSSTFDETVNSSSTPILVDFWAEWCGPCKMIAPILAEIAGEKSGNLTVAKLNVDDHGDIAGKFRISGIPAVLIFKGGAEATRLVGLQPEAAFDKALEQLV